MGWLLKFINKRGETILIRYFNDIKEANSFMDKVIEMYTKFHINIDLTLCDNDGKIIRSFELATSRFPQSAPKEIEQVGSWNKEEVYDAISNLVKIQSNYSLFEPEEIPKYNACHLAIKALMEVINKE